MTEEITPVAMKKKILFKKSSRQKKYPIYRMSQPKIKNHQSINTPVGIMIIENNFMIGDEISCLHDD